MILLDKQITKVLISLPGCAGWSVPVLLANPRGQVFSRGGPYYNDLKEDTYFSLSFLKIIVN